MKKIISKSRRRTPWSGVPDATALQVFIDDCNQNNYYSVELNSTRAPGGGRWVKRFLAIRS
jgi:hypothetical protein